MERKEVREGIWEKQDGNDPRNSSGGKILEGGTVITLGYIEELDNEERLIGEML